MGARMLVCFRTCQPGLQVTQSGSRAQVPMGALAAWVLGPGYPHISDRQLWVWMLALLRASEGAFLPGATELGRFLSRPWWLQVEGAG